MRGSQSWMRYFTELDIAPAVRPTLKEGFELLASIDTKANKWTYHAVQLVQTLSSWAAPDSLLLSAVLICLFSAQGTSEESTYTRADLARQFGETSVRLAAAAYGLSVMGMDAPDAKESTWVRVPHAARLAKLYRASYVEYEVALLCLADHVALLTDLAQFDVSQQHSWAELTNTVFVPLCEHLGMWNTRHQLAEASLPLLASEREIKPLNSFVLNYQTRYTAMFTQIEPTLQTLLAPLRMKVAISLHSPSPAGLYQRDRKAKRLGTDSTLASLGSEANIMRVDVIVLGSGERRSDATGSLDCYLVAGALNHLAQVRGGEATEIPRMQDHIVRPNVNGYQALITNLNWREAAESDSGSEGAQQHWQIQFRVRTAAMEKINTAGVTAMFPVGVGATAPSGAWWANWRLRRFIDANGPADKTTNVYVFRPNGDVQMLPYGSTALDYAFKIRSSLGVYTHLIRVDGAVVHRGYRLYNGALVEVEFDRSYAAVDAEWEQQATSPSAKQIIRKWLKRPHTPQEKGRELVDRALTRELSAHGLRLPVDEITRQLERIAIERGCGDLQRLYVDVQADRSESRITADQVVMSVIEAQYIRQIARADNQPLSPATLHIARCCLNSEFWRRKRPADAHITPDAPIVGYEAGGKQHYRLDVHHRDCAWAPRQSRTAVPLRWVGYTRDRQAAQVTIIAYDRPHLLGTIMAHIYALYDVGVYLHSLSAKVLDDATVEIEFVVDARKMEDLAPLRTALDQMKRNGDIHSVEFWRYLPGSQVLLTSYSLLTRPNPYTLQAIHDSTMFFGREDELRELLITIKDNVRLLVIDGQSGIGKSTLLNQLFHTVRSTLPAVLPVLIDVSTPPKSGAAFLLALAGAAYKQAQAAALTWGRPIEARPLAEKQLGRDPFHAFQRWINDFIKEYLGGRRIVFLIDEFSRMDDIWSRRELDHDFFINLRWLINSLEVVQFVLVTHDTLYQSPEYGVEPGNIALLLRKAQYFRMTPLSDDAARNLIRQPLGDLYTYDDDVVDAIVRLTGGYPLLLQLICLELTTTLARTGRTQVGSTALSEVVGRITSGAAAEGYLWRLLDELRASPEHRLVLTGVALAAERAEARQAGETSNFARYVHRWVTQTAITDIVDSVDVRRGMRRLSEYEVGEKLDELVTSGVVQRRQGEGEREITYRIPIGLYTEWLLDHAPIPRALPPMRPQVADTPRN